MFGSFYQYSKPLLFAGVMFLKSPKNSKIAIHEVKTIWKEWG
jgi:hypothetical protein